MTNQQLTPTEELLNQWCYASLGDWRDIATKAAKWGADQELEACVNWVSEYCPYFGDFPLPEDKLRTFRRPQPSSLKEEALLLLDEFSDPEGLYLDVKSHNTIRRALEQLDD